MTPATLSAAASSESPRNVLDFFVTFRWRDVLAVRLARERCDAIRIFKPYETAQKRPSLAGSWSKARRNASSPEA
jgi:hypothetical protein